MGNTKGGNFHHVWMAGQDVFNLCGPNIETTRNDHVVSTVHHVQITVGIELAEVTGFDPAVDNALGTWLPGYSRIRSSCRQNERRFRQLRW